MDILGQSALIVSVSSFALALHALARNYKNKLVLSFSVLCIAISFWAFFFFLEKVFPIGSFYTLHLSFNLLLAPIGLFFVQVLTRIKSRFYEWLYRVTIAYSFVLIFFQWTSLGEKSLVKNLAYFGPTFLVVPCLYFMLIEQSLKSTHHHTERASTVGLRRKSWIYIGALLILSIAAMDHVPFLGDVVPSIGNILLCIYLFIISEAIIHQRLLDISALLNRVVTVGIMSACLTMLYIILVAWIDNSPSLFILNTFLASFLMIFLVEPMKKLTNLSLVHLFSKKYFLLQKKIEDSKRSLIGVVDSFSLAQLILSVLENLLIVESATVFILRSDGTKYRRIRGLRDDSLAYREILSSHPIVEFFNKMRKKGEAPVILNHYLENEIDRSVTQSQKQAYELVLNGLMGLNANLAIPLIDQKTILGFVAVKTNAPPPPWGNNWGVLSVIYPFFVQAANTLKSMDVYVRLKEKERLASLGIMAAGLAHEIRNPLGAIKGAAQYLQSENEYKESAFIQVIVEEVNRLNQVVTQFLDYSRPFAVDLVETDLGQILERTYALFQNAPQEGVQIQFLKNELSALHLPKVLCAPEQIKQVLVNLVRNSIQSLLQDAPKSQAYVRMGAELVYAQEGARATEVLLFVEDNGRGILRENYEKIFIPFFTTKSSGTGLGLPICARIIEAHGGRIEVTSEAWKSTRFTLSIPCVHRQDWL